MEKYYSKEEQEKYGVVGIEIELISIQEYIVKFIKNKKIMLQVSYEKINKYSGALF